MWTIKARHLQGLLLFLRSHDSVGLVAAAFNRFGPSQYPSSYRYSRSTLTSHESADFDSDEIPKDYPRRDDVLVALAAVREACNVTKRIQPTQCSSSAGVATVMKVDLSPVTVGDLAAQAIILRRLNEAFQEDSFIAEEDSQPLKADETLAQTIVREAKFDGVDDAMRSIDLGKSYLSWSESRGRPSRVWCLDPIDGTKGFLRGKKEGGQYAVALALLEDGMPTIGIIGCPNLPLSSTTRSFSWSEDETEENSGNSRGCIFVASEGGGCYQLPLVPSSSCTRLHVTNNDGTTVSAGEGRFCLGVERGIADALGQCNEMAKIIHGKQALDAETGDIINARRIDSMAKYALLARGDAEYYVRLPKPDYVENIWDHAAGAVVINEAGGQVTDTAGEPLDFSLGVKLSTNVRGILASSGGIFHQTLVQSYAEQEASR